MDEGSSGGKTRNGKGYALPPDRSPSPPKLKRQSDIERLEILSRGSNRSLRSCSRSSVSFGFGQLSSPEPPPPRLAKQYDVGSEVEDSPQPSPRPRPVARKPDLIRRGKGKGKGKVSPRNHPARPRHFATPVKGCIAAAAATSSSSTSRPLRSSTGKDKGAYFDYIDLKPKVKLEASPEPPSVKIKEEEKEIDKSDYSFGRYDKFRKGRLPAQLWTRRVFSVTRGKSPLTKSKSHLELSIVKEKKGRKLKQDPLKGRCKPFYERGKSPPPSRKWRNRYIEKSPPLRSRYRNVSTSSSAPAPVRKEPVKIKLEIEKCPSPSAEQLAAVPKPTLAFKAEAHEDRSLLLDAFEGGDNHCQFCMRKVEWSDMLVCHNCGDMPSTSCYLKGHVCNFHTSTANRNQKQMHLLVTDFRLRSGRISLSQINSVVLESDFVQTGVSCQRAEMDDSALLFLEFYSPKA